MARPAPTLDYENDAYRGGARFVAGVDEAGRGPLAGPVVAAAVILDLARIPEGLADSKALTAERREALFIEVVASARVSVAVAGTGEIERLNIRGATLAAMARAVAGLSLQPCAILVDGLDRPQAPCPATPIVDGDALCLSIAAASIVAKVTRDRIMIRMAGRFPGYGFEAHKGYGTPGHLEALRRLGPCPAHRRGFAPIAQLNLALGG